MFKLSGNIHPNYKKYILYSSLSNIICGFESIISTHSMFSASGIGKENIELASISLNLLGKDIIGQVFSIPFINKMSKIGNIKPLKYAKINIVIFESSNFLECITPFLHPQLFIPLASLGNIGKNVGFTGFASFNANAISKLSIDKTNIIEIYSKITILNSLSYSFGMSIGLCFVTFSNNIGLKFFILSCCGFIRYFCIKKSVEMWDDF